MYDISGTCPLCKATSQYGAELIGRYTLCPACRGRFYIEVPPLGEAKVPAELQLPLPTTALRASSTTLDDLLWDTQRGTRFVIESLWRIESRLKWQTYSLAMLLALLLVIAAKLVVK